MAEFLTGQQRHHLWFLKVAIALASVGDGSNLPRPDKLETKPRMAPELWICAKLEIASSNVTSSGGETRLMWKSAGDDEPGPIVAALASLRVLQGCRSRGRVWTGTTKLPRQGLRPRNNLVLDSERSDPVIHRHESPRHSIQTKSFAAAQPPSRTLGSSPAAVRPARSRKRYELPELGLALPTTMFPYHGSV